MSDSEDNKDTSTDKAVLSNHGGVRIKRVFSLVDQKSVMKMIRGRHEAAA